MNPLRQRTSTSCTWPVSLAHLHLLDERPGRGGSHARLRRLVVLRRELLDPLTGSVTWRHVPRLTARWLSKPSQRSNWLSHNEHVGTQCGW